MVKVKFEDLLSTGAHFGHVTRKWNPNFKPFILMEKIFGKKITERVGTFLKD